MSLIYIILLCNAAAVSASGSLGCTPAPNNASFTSPQDCLTELPKLYDGAVSDQPDSSGKFFMVSDSDTWLECIGARADDGRIVQPAIAP